MTPRTTCALVVLALLGLACGGPPRGGAALANQEAPAPPAPGKLLLVTAGNVYLEGALLALVNEEAEGLPDFDKVTPAELDRMVAGGKLPSYRAVILDDHTPKALPSSVPLLYFNPTGAHAPFRIRTRTARPRVVAVDDSHPITRWITLSDTRFDDASIFELDADRGDVALVTTDGGPLIAAGQIARRRVVACGFALSSTDLPLRVAFPIFLMNALDWLMGRPPRSPHMTVSALPGMRETPPARTGGDNGFSMVT